MVVRDVELVASVPLSPSVRALTFRTVDRSALSFVAGQWVNLHLVIDGTPIKRAYSIANAPSAQTPDQLELAVTLVEGGVMSTALHSLAVGARLSIDGPHGFFTREPSHRTRPALFVGTGTGLAPLRAMLQEEVSQPAGPPLVLLFGCRSTADILWRAELDAWVARCPRLRVEVTLSRGDEAWLGRRGYVQAHLVELARALEQPQVYVCGLSHMVQEVRRLLKEELDLDRKQIQSERYD